MAMRRLICLSITEGGDVHDTGVAGNTGQGGISRPFCVVERELADTSWG